MTFEQPHRTHSREHPALLKSYAAAAATITIGVASRYPLLDVYRELDLAQLGVRDGKHMVMHV